MKRWYHVNVRCYIMSLWTLIVILLMLPHYSECGGCIVLNCNSLECNGSKCESCNYGYFLQLESCTQCPDRCSTCTSSTQCTTCKDTYWNVYNGCYSNCSDNCLDRRCNDTTGFCYSCITGKYGPQCKQDCNLCEDGHCDLRQCTNGCKDGYYQETTTSGYSYCYKCVYDNCITCSNGTFCTQCKQGYYKNYFRLEPSGRGTMNCLQCNDTCLDCTSTELCHEDCIQHCSEPVTQGTTKSTYESTTIQSGPSNCSSSKTEPPTETQKAIESIKSTESTPHEDFQILNEELNKDLNRCQQQIKTHSESNDENQLTFGHGFATGFGVAILSFGSGVGIALLIRRRTKQHKHVDKNSEGHHEYVNTDMTDILSATSLGNNAENNGIHTVSSDLTNTGVTNIESTRDYVMLGDRPTHESDYTDLQTT